MRMHHATVIALLIAASGAEGPVLVTAQGNLGTYEDRIAVEDVMALLVELPDASLVCTHREVFLQLFAGEISCEKGGAWVLERVGALLSPLEYIAPPSTVPDPFQRIASAR